MENESKFGKFLNFFSLVLLSLLIVLICWFFLFEKAEQESNAKESLQKTNFIIQNLNFKNPDAPLEIKVEEEGGKSAPKTNMDPENQESPINDNSSQGGEQSQTAPEAPVPSAEIFSKDAAKIAIIVSNLGINKSSTDMAIKLPKEIGLAFSPYANDLDKYIASASDLNHEIYAFIPMENQRYPLDQPGELGLLKNSAPSLNENNLEDILRRLKGIKGILTPAEEVITSNKAQVAMILNKMMQAKIFWVYGKTIPTAEFIEANNSSKKANFIVNNVVLDNQLDKYSIREKLIELENAAKANSVAVGIIHPYPISIQELQSWIAGISNKEIRLVQVSDLLGNSQ